jgi:hypothetical protein
MATTFINAIPAQPTEGPAQGIFGGFATPASFTASAMAAQESLGPVTRAFSDLAADLIKSQIAAAMVGGSDELSDQSSNRMMNPIIVPMRARANRYNDWHRSFTKGACLFSSLVQSTAAADKHTLATIPMLNLWQEQLAYADARLFAKQEPELGAAQLAVLRALTPRTPGQFAEMWGFCGIAAEPSIGNATAAEPLWSVGIEGAGRVEVANSFGSHVQMWDELSIVVRLEEPIVELSAQPHAPQPVNVLRIKCHASRGAMHHMTNRQALAPNPGDVDCIAKNWPIKPVWRERSKDVQAGRWTDEAERWTENTLGLGALVASQFNMDLYTHGFRVRVGYVVDERPVSAVKELVDAAHVDMGAYARLPNIGIVPYVARL